MNNIFFLLDGFPPVILWGGVLALEHACQEGAYINQTKSASRLAQCLVLARWAGSFEFLQGDASKVRMKLGLVWGGLEWYLNN